MSQSIAAVPAPWSVTSRTWTFLLSGLPSTSSFPAGFANLLEADALASGGKYIGGPGVVLVVSYVDTPVGPYDELAYIPGRWRYTDGSVGFRVTRIYVSTKASTENGRRNWNIPKFVADFNIATASDGVSTIEVFLPGATEPFFHVVTKPVPLMRHIPLPLNTALLNKYFTLVQPPLPAGEKPEEVSTTQWASLTPVLKGRGYLEHIFPQLDGKVGNGKEFPAVIPWSIGTYSAKMAGQFVVAEHSASK